MLRKLEAERRQKGVESFLDNLWKQLKPTHDAFSKAGLRTDNWEAGRALDCTQRLLNSQQVAKVEKAGTQAS